MCIKLLEIDESIDVTFCFSHSNSKDAEDKYMQEYIGNITYYDSDTGEGYSVGNLKAFVVDVGGAIDNDYPISELFDLRHETLHFYESLFDLDYEGDLNNIVEKTLDTKFNFGFNRLLILDRLEIKPEYRGKSLGLVANEITISALGVMCDLVALKAYPLQHELKHIENNNSPEERAALNGFEADEEKALQQLKAYYARSGFKSINDRHTMIRIP